MRLIVARPCLVSVKGLAVLICLFLSRQLYAQHVYTVGTTVDVAAGLDNNPQLTSVIVAPAGKTQGFFSVYPGLSLSSNGAHSTLAANYTFGWSRTHISQTADSRSHAANVNWTSQISARTTVNFGDTYSLTNDIQTLYALRGVQLEADQTVFLFEPVVANQSFTTNYAAVGFSHNLSERSTISFGGNQSMRLYSTNGVRNSLSDQQLFTGTAGYSRRLNKRFSWELDYSGSYYNFNTYNDAIANVVRTGFTYSFGRSATATLTAGPSFVRDLKNSTTDRSYQVVASVQQKLKENDFQFLFSQDNSSTTGLGSISKTTRGTISFSRSLSRRVSVAADATAFDSKGVLDNTLETRGLSSSANVGVELVKRFSLQGGVLYQRYTNEPYETTQKRVFVSLRYSHPNLLRVH